LITEYDNFQIQAPLFILKLYKRNALIGCSTFDSILSEAYPYPIFQGISWEKTLIYKSSARTTSCIQRA